MVSPWFFPEECLGDEEFRHRARGEQAYQYPTNERSSGPKQASETGQFQKMKEEPRTK